MEPGVATDLFFSLTPEKVLAAVEAAGLRCRPLCYPLNSFENRVYEVELADRTRVVAKFYRPGRWSEAQILAEHRFLAELDADEIPVCAVRPFCDGSTLRQIDHIYYCLFDRCGGRAPDEVDDALARRAGRLAARIHNVGARHDAPDRLRLSADRYIRDNLAWLAAHDTLPPHFAGRYFQAANAIADLADELLQDVPVHRLHGDLHLGNLLLRDGFLRVLDFDDMVVGPAVQDVWLLFPGRDVETLRLRDVFLAGYEELRLFDPTSLRLVEPLRSLRLVHFSAWLARRWHDPIFPATWPDFGTETYWWQQTEDLEEQLRLIRSERPLHGPQAVPTASLPAEEPLTNKDYFWDWEGD